jgi:hypothetical protein
MALNCGREIMCTPCLQLPEGDQAPVCISVNDAIGSLVVSEISLEELPNEMYERLAFWVDDDDHVSQQMVNVAVASLIEIKAAKRVPYSGPQHTLAEIEE